MRIISKQDIQKAVTFEDVIQAVESAFLIYENKNFSMPDRMHADYRGNTLLLMPCFAGRFFGTKLVSLFPKNTQKNLPVLFGLMVLNDGKTGIPLALLNGSTLTAYRTGAVGGVGVKHLAPENVETLGVIGCGVQGYYQTLFACSQRNIKKISLFDFIPEKASELKNKLSMKFPSIEIHPVSSSKELVAQSQIIITATNSEQPVFPDEKGLLKGKTCIGIGSYKPNMREFPESLFRLLDRVFIDNDFAVGETGDLVDPIRNNWIDCEKICTFGQLITGAVTVDKSAISTRVFKSVGMALFDVVVAEMIYNKAIEKNLGKEIEF